MKPNYGFAKRQRELAKKQKKEEKLEEKRLRKQAEAASQDGTDGESPGATSPAAGGPVTASGA